MSSIEYARLHSDPDGRSHVQRGMELALTSIDFAPPAPPVNTSPRLPASALLFLHLPAGWRGDWHPSPNRQWVLCLQGEFEYETGDGRSYRIGAGGFMLTEDTTGRGHRSRVVSKADVLLAVVQL